MKFLTDVCEVYEYSRYKEGSKPSKDHLLPPVINPFFSLDNAQVHKRAIKMIQKDKALLAKYPYLSRERFSMCPPPWSPGVLLPVAVGC